MEDLFRFIMHRPPQHAELSAGVSVEEETQFQEDLLGARESESPRQRMKEVAQQYISSDNFLKDLSDLNYYQQLKDFYERISDGIPLNLMELKTLVKETFDQDADVLVAEESFIYDKRRVTDSIIAIVIVPPKQSKQIDDLSHIIRLIALIERVSINDESLDEENAVQSSLIKTIVLPGKLFPLPPPVTSLKKREALSTQVSYPDEMSKLNDELETRANILKSTIDELMGMKISDYVDLEELNASVDEKVSKRLSGDSPTKKPRKSSKKNKSIIPSTEFKQIQSVQLTLKPEAVGSLMDVTKTVFEELRLDATTDPVPVMVEKIENEISKLAGQLADLESKVSRCKNIIRIGSTYFNLRSSSPVHRETSTEVMGTTTTLPTTHTTIQPVGIGDFKVVKQQLKKYEAGELAHIENILKGESKEREHRRSKVIEDIFVIETETIQEEERDLQSTERFELQQETTKTIQEDTSRKAGVSISGSYGPTVEFTATADFTSDRSKEESSKHATNYAKDVTSRSVSKISERVRTERTRRTVEEFEEINRHALDNTGGAEHIIGVYQWIDKIYEAQVFNYGRRLLFDIILPEPAAFLIYALETNPPEGEGLEEPEPFNIPIVHIDEFNYQYFARKYKVTDIEPPPKSYITISEAFNERSESKESSAITKSIKLKIPNGYYAVSGFAQILHNSWEGEDLIYDILLAIGKEYTISFWYEQIALWGFYLDNEVDSIPIALTTSSTKNYSVAIEIKCKRTSRAFKDWQIETYAAIMQGYQMMLSEYEEKLAAAVTEQESKITGRNPVLNREIEHTELKKACISMLTLQHFDIFDLIENGSEGYPQTDVPTTEILSKYIRFFEQAFEWEQMMYVFYPYYWGRKKNWIDRIHIEDIDPIHAEFLKAGAARVVFPVRPGFQAAIRHFLETGDIDFGFDDISSPTYLPITEEIREKQGVNGEETPDGEPWEVKLPTTLVRLKNDSTLPEWEKDEDGNWRPIE